MSDHDESSTDGPEDLQHQISRLQSSNNGYKFRISVLEKDISTLMASKAISNQEIAKYMKNQEIIATLQSELSETQQQLSECRAIIDVNRKLPPDTVALDQKDRQCAELSKTVGRLQRSFADMKSRNSNLEHQLALANSENAQLVIENVELKQQVRDLASNESLRDAKSDRALQDLRQTNAELTSQLSELKAIRSNLEHLIGATQQENDRLKTDLDQLRENELQSKSEITRLIHANQTSLQQLSANQSELQRLRSDHDAAKAQLHQSQSDAAALKTAKDSESRQRSLAASQLLELQQTRDSLARELTETRASCARLRAAASQLELANAQLASSLDEHDRERRDADAKRDSLARELTEARASCGRLRAAASQLELANAQLDEHDRERRDADAKRDSLERELTETRASCEHLRAAASQLELANAKLASSLDEHDRERRDADAKRARFEREIEELRRELQSLRCASRRSAARECDAFAALKAKCEALSTELSALKATERAQLESARRQSEAADRAFREMSANVVASARRFAAQALRQIRAIHNRYLAALGGRVEAVRRAFEGLARAVRGNLSCEGGERVRFLRQIESHLRLIDNIAIASAELVSFPRQRIPPAADLVNQPRVLEAFLRQLADVAQERHSCHHTMKEVRTLVRNTYV